MGFAGQEFICSGVRWFGFWNTQSGVEVKEKKLIGNVRLET